MANAVKESGYTFDPDLSARFRGRFDKLTDKLLVNRSTRQQEYLIDCELKAMDLGSNLSGDQLRYVAVLEVLHDLVEIGYRIKKGTHVELIPPSAQNGGKSGALREWEREILRKERRVQFQKESIQRFITNMEDGANDDSVLDLITPGQDLHARLDDLRDGSGQVPAKALRGVIDPYLQVAESGKTCPRTGLDLMDIWRYFRYTWLTPYRTVPGRNINLLIRNRALPNHPVMGIASVASPMMNLKARDRHLGWRVDAIERELGRKHRTHEVEEQLPKDQRRPGKRTRTVRNIEWLETTAEWEARTERFASNLLESLWSTVDSAIRNIRWDDLLPPQLIDENGLPKREEAVEKLLYSRELEAKKEEEQSSPRPRDQGDWKARSEDPLFVKKRARTLRHLLEVSRFLEGGTGQPALAFLKEVLESSGKRKLLERGLRELKKEKVSSCILNIMVCGGIPPYSYLTAGKLAAMASTGPQVIQTYRQKYADYESHIASSLKGEPVIRENEVVWFETTSLFETGSAQYSRIRMPTDDGNRTEFLEIGTTDGFGSIQFGHSTRERLSEVVRRSGTTRETSDRFGSGIAPRMRKIRQGLEQLGLDGDLLHHNSRRLVFGVPVASNYQEYLRGFEDEPHYYWNLDDAETAQQRIYDHWLERWCAMRASKQTIRNKIRSFEPSDLALSKDVGQEMGLDE